MQRPRHYEGWLHSPEDGWQKSFVEETLEAAVARAADILSTREPGAFVEIFDDYGLVDRVLQEAPEP